MDIDVGRSIRFVFEDEDWLPKVLIGGLVNLVPIVNLAVAGYGLRVLRNVATGRELPLPDWGDFGDYFGKGLAIFVATLIYLVPLAGLAVLAAVVGAAAALSGDGGAAAAGVTVLACLAATYGLLVAIWLPGATAIYAAEGEFAAFFHFRQIWNLIIRNLDGYILALLASFVVALVASVIGGLLFGVGALFTGFIAAVIAAHLFGQVLRESGHRLRAV